MSGLFVNQSPIGKLWSVGTIFAQTHGVSDHYNKFLEFGGDFQFNFDSKEGLKGHQSRSGYINIFLWPHRPNLHIVFSSKKSSQMGRIVCCCSYILSSWVISDKNRIPYKNLIISKTTQNRGGGSLNIP